MDNMESYLTKIGGTIFIKLPQTFVMDSGFPVKNLEKIKQYEKIRINIKIENGEIKTKILGDQNGENRN